MVGMSVMAMGAPFMEGMVQGAQKEAKDQGIQLVVCDAYGNMEKQMNQIADLVARDVDALLIQPKDIGCLASSAEKARENGIPVFCIDTNLESDAVACWIASDNREMGREGARLLAKLLYGRYGAYQGKVVNLMASLTSTSGIQRSEGFLEVMQDYPEIEIVATQNTDLYLEEALTVTSNLLQKFPDLDGIWCAGDNAGLGVIRAIEQAGRFYPAGEKNHIYVVSADGAAEALEAVRNGEMDACVSQNPVHMGQAAMGLIGECLRTGELPDKPFYDWPLFLITPETVDSKEHQKYGIWSEELQ